mmetsp:Transcript_21425/g.64299  ORF Transcript_21425/g.64299 Transcript_21425/m.64299 type:complete len:294 (+) Transcript_21425:50-931(+)
MAGVCDDDRCERIVLPDVQNFTQTHDIQPWCQCDLGGVVAARLVASWRDQGWGNQKGAIHARVASSDGVQLLPWRRVGPYPAPHKREDVDVELPAEFFAGKVPAFRLAVTEHTHDALQIPGDDPASSVAVAVYGSGSDTFDVTDVVRRELKAGRPVRASNDLFGDPCFGAKKTLTVTLTEEAATLATEAAMPGDARVELGFEVGGGGGHQLYVREAALLVERVAKVLTATATAQRVEITNMSGEIVAVVPREGSEDVSDDEHEASICDAVRSALGPGQPFKVVMAGSNRVVRG